MGIITRNKSEWELDFYSRPILEDDGKKRWELLVTNTRSIADEKIFKWEKRCPAGEVNSLWLTQALNEAIEAAQKEGWEKPTKIRCWRKSMKTMISRAASQLSLDVVPSRRTYNLIEWISQRERELYPKEKGYMVGPLAPPPKEILNDPIPLPESVRGDFLSLDSLPVGIIKYADEWPIEFRGLIPVPKNNNEEIDIPGIRLFSEERSLALAGWLGSLEPVRLVINKNQLILEAGQEDQWLVTDLKEDIAIAVQESLMNSKINAGGLQFIAVQASTEEKSFAGFWMLKDII